MSKSNYKKSASDYLQRGNGDLKLLFTKLKEMEYLSHKIAAYMDFTLHRDYKIAPLKDNCLILIASNASIATHLRFQIPDFLKKFEQDPHLKKIRNINCKVSPHLSITHKSSKTHHRKIALLSAKTSRHLQEAAQTIKDEKLRRIMERIAKHRAE